MAARICAVHGSRGVLIASSLLSPLLLPVLALSQSPLQFGLTLIALGASVAAMDVSMNAHGVALERSMDRPITSSLHAGWSLGGLVGAAAVAVACNDR